MHVHRAEDRFVTRSADGESFHAFSFGRHYDPGNTSFGPLVAVNEEHLRAGCGFAEHPHRDVELVTWVLQGQLLHRNSAGRAATVEAGRVQVLSAGDGVVHSESAGDGPVRFVQAWLQPDAPGGEPAHSVVSPGTGPWVALASGRGHAGAAPLRRRDAVLWLGRLAAGEARGLPEAPRVYVHVASGRLRGPGGEVLQPADALRLDAAGPVELVAELAAEVLVWELG